MLNVFHPNPPPREGEKLYTFGGMDILIAIMKGSCHNQTGMKELPGDFKGGWIED
jgi:hypothetical protein